MEHHALIQKIDAIIKKVWTEDLSVDYDNYYLFKEDTLKNAFYYHLRTRLGEEFLHQHHIRIYTEYYVQGNRIDLVIVQIDPALAMEHYLGAAVNKVLVTVEMKYKGESVPESVFYEDIKNIYSYINSWGREAKHYFAFIQEKYFHPDDILQWIENEAANELKGKVTELYAYWNERSDQTVWHTIDY